MITFTFHFYSEIEQNHDQKQEVSKSINCDKFLTGNSSDVSSDVLWSDPWDKDDEEDYMMSL